MPYLTLLAALIFAASPFFVTGFAGFDPNQFPVPQDNPPTQPAGYAFAIWGLIYLWLIVGTGFGAFWRKTNPDWQTHRLPLFVSLSVGSSWLATAQWSPIAATISIWAMLASALVALFATGRDRRWLQQAPVAIYAGWLTAASSVSIGLLLAGYGWAKPTAAALIALCIALGLTVKVQTMLKRAPEYGVTVIWALVAVVVANTDPLNAVVAGFAALGCVVVAMTVWQRAV